MPRSGAVARSGPPMPCSQCRTPFRTSLVGSSKRKKLANPLCPRCLSGKKAKKKKAKGSDG